MSGPIPKPRKRKRPARRNYQEQADKLFSQHIRNRDQRCQNCGTFDRLQCAHLISRSYKSIRTDEENAVALCSSCHTYFTHRPLEWLEWIEVEFPGRYERLRVKALAYSSVDWKGEVGRLKGDQ